MNKMKFERLVEVVQKHLVLIVILVFSAGLRIMHLTRESLWLDEIYSIRFIYTRNLLQLITDSFQTDYHPFLYYALLDSWINVIGCSDFTARALSVSLGAAGVLSAYLLSKIFFKNIRVALFCAFLTAISPVHIQYSQEVRMYILLILAWPLFLVTLHSCWRTCCCIRSCFWTLVTFGIFSYAHSVSGLFALPVLGMFAGLFVLRSIFLRRRADALRGVMLIGLATVMYSPWLVRLLVLKTSDKQLGPFGVQEACHFFQWMLFDPRSRSVISTGHLLAGVLAVMILLLAVFRWKQLFRHVVYPAFPMIASVGTILVLQFLLNLLRPCYQQRNIVFLLIPSLACMSFFMVKLLSLSLNSLATRLPRWAAFSFTLFLCMTFCLVVAHGTIRQIRYGVGKHQWREAVKEVGSSIREGDILAFYAPYTQQCWEHYAFGYESPTKEVPPLPRHYIFGIDGTRNKSISVDSVQEVISEMNAVNSDQNSLWVFYSHASDAARVDSLLKSGHLREIGSWRGRSIEVKRYVKENGTPAGPNTNAQ